MKLRTTPQQETVADYDVRSPAVRTVLTVLGTLVVVAVLAGLVLGASILSRDTRVATSRVDVSEVAALKVMATDADLTIVEGEPDLLTITSKITSGLRTTDYQLGRRGDEIKLATRCQEWLNPGCGVSTTLKVPPGLPLVIRTSAGDISATSISQGVLTVSSTTGDIKASALGVDEFSAQTTAGNVSATFRSQPFAFKATTTSGDVRATIPGGDRTYDVMTMTGSGSIDSDLKSDADGEGFVRVKTGSGDIRLTAG